MVDSTLSTDWVILIGGRFGLPVDDKVPLGGFAGASHHNVATAVYRPGTVKAVPIIGYPTVLHGGTAEFVYLQYDGTGATAMVARDICVPANIGASGNWYQFTNDPDATNAVEDGHGWAVVALGDMTDDYYGWFWCGGPVPEDHEADLAGVFLTSGADIAVGTFIASNCTSDDIGLGLNNATTDQIIGTTLVADA